MGPGGVAAPRPTLGWGETGDRGRGALPCVSGTWLVGGRNRAWEMGGGVSVGGAAQQGRSVRYEHGDLCPWGRGAFGLVALLACALCRPRAPGSAGALYIK